jgi:hypothetical protein
VVSQRIGPDPRECYRGRAAQIAPLAQQAA